MALPASQAPAGTFRLYLPLMDQLRQAGVEPAGFLAGLGLPVRLLEAPDAPVTRSEQEKLWLRAIEATGDPLFPARVARGFPPETIGVIVYLARASADGLAAVRRVQSFIRLIQDEGELELRLEPQLAVICVHQKDGHVPILPVSEYYAALHVFMGRAMSGGSREPREIRIAHPEPRHAAELAAFLGVPVRYGAAEDGVAWPRAQFTHPNANADEGLSALLEGYARDLLEKLPVSQTTAGRVRAALLPRLSRGTPGLEEIAAELRMSARTLRRRLRDEGTSYRSTLDALRHELALRALEQRDFSVDAIALDLGYSDPSAFHKAFRRWTGSTPAAYAAGR